MSNVPMDDGWSFPEENHRAGYGLDSRIMLTAILSVVFVIVLFVVLHLYVRFVLRRNHTDRRRLTIRLRRIGLTIPHNSPPSIIGLDPSAIAALPTFAYRQADDGDRISAECTVCLSAMEEGEMVRLLPNCKHVFHVECIDMWLHSHSTCPVCRAEAQPLVVVAAVVEVGEASGPPLPPGVIGAGGLGESSSASKEGGSVSRLSSSFRKMLNREKSGRRVNGDGMEDLERQ